MNESVQLEVFIAYNIINSYQLMIGFLYTDGNKTPIYTLLQLQCIEVQPS